MSTATPEIILDPAQREFPPFSMSRLLSTVFEPTEGCRVCILSDFEDPAAETKGFAFLDKPEKYPVQKRAYEEFYLRLKDGGMEELGMTGGEMFGYHATKGSNLDLRDECFDTEGKTLSLDRDIYPNYDIILCLSD